MPAVTARLLLGLTTWMTARIAHSFATGW